MLPDVFTYFEGGREGIKQRLAEQIRDGIASIPSAEIAELEREIKLQDGAISRIVAGDLSELTAEPANDLACCLSLDWGKALGEWNFNEEDRQAWEQQMKGFISVGGPVQDLVRVFTTLRALDSL